MEICGVNQGGRHVDYVTDQIITKLLEVVKRKEKKAGVAIKPFQVDLVLENFFCIFSHNQLNNENCNIFDLQKLIVCIIDYTINVIY